MADLHFKLADYGPYLRKLAKSEIPAAMDRAMLSAALRCVPIMQTRTRRAPASNPSGISVGGAFNYGDYLRAWKAVPIPRGARLLNDRRYASVIEEGRRPGATRPPILALTHWAQRRLGVSAEDAKKIAFAVANSIKSRGLLPRRVLGSAMPELWAAANAEIVRELRRVL